MANYRIVEGSLSIPNERTGGVKLRLANEMVTDKELSATTIWALLASGQIVPEGAVVPKVEPTGVQISGDRVQVQVKKPSTPPPLVREPLRGFVPIPVVQTKTPETETPNAAKTVSPWTLAPESLAGKTLQELNAMILERDSAMKPMDTVDEARAVLCLDYEPPAK